MDPAHSDAANLRNFRDFLLLFNVISESCFSRCVRTFNSRTLTDDELQCVHRCASKHIRVNNKIMEIYVEVQPLITQKRIEEMNAMQEKLAEQKAAETPQVNSDPPKTETQSDISTVQQ